MKVSKTQEKIFNFIEQFFNVVVENDGVGLPSIINVNENKFSLCYSINRHNFRSHIERLLVESHAFSISESKIYSDLYCEHKYDIYKKVVMKL
jgi:hypothetical protein